MVRMDFIRTMNIITLQMALYEDFCVSSRYEKQWQVITSHNQWDVGM